jgi:o-succinylbenzoate synthase
MLKAASEKVELIFKRPAGTSRGVLKTKNCWIIKIWDTENPENVGIGEASIIESLSPDWSESYPHKIKEVVQRIDEYASTFHDNLVDFPSVRFAIEMALTDLKHQEDRMLFPSEFTSGQEGIRINGLIWMGDHSYMLDQIEQKLESGFSCIKLKIGAIDFEQELDLLDRIRKRFSADDLELRVDANGAFEVDEALQNLDRLNSYNIHSIEQPIKQGQWEEMYDLCRKTPIPIALDEELIGINDPASKTKMIQNIQPQYIILKPSLVGGFRASDEWIELAEKQNIGWWITSALESNIGLNAIAQYTFTKNNSMPQGLGTGMLFENNIASTLTIKGEHLFHH